MPIKNMNDLINIDEDIYKSKKNESKISQTIFEGKKETKKVVVKKKPNTKNNAKRY